MNRIKIMGILNVTPDSFYDGGKFFDRSRAIERAYEIFSEGADMIDIGGESTRPGAKPVSEQEEMDRVIPVISALSRTIPIPLSVDTRKAAVAGEAMKAGARVINDVSGLSFDGRMASTAARYGATLILMHIQGNPETMQNAPVYGDIIREIGESLEESAHKAMEAGIGRDKIILDPGIGFGKTIEQNYIIIKNIHHFKKQGFPVLIGLSRKSLIGRLYREECDRLPATIALNAVSVLNGADIIRVHDVREHRLAMESLDMLKKVS